MRLKRVGTLILALALLGPALVEGQVQWGPVPTGYPQTAAELNGFTAHTRHDEMWDFLEGLRSVSDQMRLGTYGETREGRDLPYAVYSRPLVSNPWEAMALDKPIVLFAANVHGGERTFREGLLVLMRDLATPGTEANRMLDHVTVVVAPQINPDGFEASELGQRGNAWGIDLNRDYVKLEHPEIQNYVQNLIGEWRPHLFIDGHNGGSRPYNLNYQCPTHFDAAAEISLLCDNEIFPAIDAELESENMRSWYYVRGDEEAWTVGGSQVRIGRNYGGITNSVAILFEAPQQELGIGARAGYLGYFAVLEWVANNGDHLVRTVERARAETVAMGAEPSGQVTVEMEYEAEDYLVDYTIVRGGGFNAQPGEPVDTIEVTGAQLIKKPVAVRTRDRPWAYTLPRDATDAVDLLLRHGITVEQLTAPLSVEVQAYTIADVQHERQYNHAAVTMIEVGEVLTQTMELPAGSFVVPTAQNLGRLVSHMMEVETEDNVVYWNTMDAFVPRPGTPSGRPGSGPPLSPILKIMSPVMYQAEIVRR